MTDVAFQRLDANLLQNELSESAVVMLDMDRGDYYGCEGVARTIWDALSERRTLAALVAQVKTDYPDAPSSIEGDVQAFLDDLVECSLIGPVDND